jgi:hypothetical protein
MESKVRRYQGNPVSQIYGAEGPADAFEVISKKLKARGNVMRAISCS